MSVQVYFENESIQFKANLSEFCFADFDAYIRSRFGLEETTMLKYTDLDGDDILPTKSVVESGGLRIVRNNAATTSSSPSSSAQTQFQERSEKTPKIWTGTAEAVAHPSLLHLPPHESRGALTELSETNLGVTIGGEFISCASEKNGIFSRAVCRLLEFCKAIAPARGPISTLSSFIMLAGIAYCTLEIAIPADFSSLAITTTSPSLDLFNISGAGSASGDDGGSGPIDHQEWHETTQNGENGTCQFDTCSSPISSLLPSSDPRSSSSAGAGTTLWPSVSFSSSWSAGAALLSQVLYFLYLIPRVIIIKKRPLIECIVAFISWSWPYLFIRRLLNPETNKGCIKKYASDAYYGGLAAVTSVVLKHVFLSGH